MKRYIKCETSPHYYHYSDRKYKIGDKIKPKTIRLFEEVADAYRQVTGLNDIRNLIYMLDTIEDNRGYYQYLVHPTSMMFEGFKDYSPLQCQLHYIDIADANNIDEEEVIWAFADAYAGDREAKEWLSNRGYIGSDDKEIITENAIVDDIIV